ncbi:hypothetical protein GCM10023259_043250 [Thermocatellispora tengchongensis]
MTETPWSPGSATSDTAVMKNRYRTVFNVEDCHAIATHPSRVFRMRRRRQTPFGPSGAVAGTGGNHVQNAQWGAQPESHQD